MHPLAEVFGYLISDETDEAKRYRKNKLCPFNNKVPNCTKDKANAPLGVCSIMYHQKPIITCPVRFREKLKIFNTAADFFFKDQMWTSLSEIRLNDKNGISAGNIDYVLVSYDEQGKLIDFASLEIQGVYISGNLRDPFETYMKNQSPNFEWGRGYKYPSPDFLSSSRKRLIPQIMFKGGIIKSWGKKQGIVLQKSFFDTMPTLPYVNEPEADIAWFLYELIQNGPKYELSHVDTKFTAFQPALEKITNPEPGNINDFLTVLQNKLDEALSTAPLAPTLLDIITEE